MTRITNRAKWGPAAIMALPLLAGISGPGVWLPSCRAAQHPATGAASRSTALSEASVYQGDLRYRNLRGVNLSGVVLPQGTFLTGADLTEANLQGGSLDSATLNSAHMPRANLCRADLHAADLMNTDLRGADLRDANLRAADFWNADLRGAKVDGAQYDDQTRWPEGYDPLLHGAIMGWAMSETTPFDVAIDVLSVAALIFVLAGLIVWLTPVLQLLRWIDPGETRMRVFWSCTLFGLGYGAAFGSLCELALWLPSGSGALSAVMGGAFGGALLGAFGGGIAGFVGNMIGWRIGWTLAGVFGSAAAAGCVWALLCMAFGLEPDPPSVRNNNLIEGAIWCSAAILAGGLLGAALDRALRSRRSVVPGVQQLAAIIRCGAGSEHEP